MELSAPINSIKGIGAARAAAFNKAGVYELRDLLCYFPRDYVDKSVIKSIADTAPLERCSIVASVKTAPVLSRLRGGLTALKFNVSDGSGTCKITYFNQPYLKQKFAVGDTYIFYGKFEGNLISRSLTNPSAEPADIEGAVEKSLITPVYPLVSGLTQGAVSKAVRAILNEAVQIPDPVPREMCGKYGFYDKQTAIYKLHAPQSMSDVAQARRRMVFEELLTLSLGMLMMRGGREKSTQCVCQKVDLKPFYDSLPFALTGAQKRCIDEGMRDMTSGRPMNRLVQGDVGSGKTMVAAALCYVAVKNKFQALFMAPTEILATQHVSSLEKLFRPFGIKVDALVGGMKKAEKAAALARLESGETDILIGTHAVLEQNVAFKRLGFVVCDEQQRFGVEQRSRAAAKGASPHMLVMSATPIPRTLALMIYGDLDISVVDELPPGRKQTITHVVGEDRRWQIDAFIANKLKDGKQGYIVCPMVEESEVTDGLKDVVGFAKELSKKFPSAKIGLIHGRMTAAEKETQMALFRSGEMKILVSTTVIEIGVDVPNANFMIIENAERFGLAALHQLRGRVGRGTERAYCILVSDAKGDTATTRLKAMEETTDGFELARRDLEMRGPGDFFGNRQSGIPALSAASMAVDSREMHLAAEEAKNIFGQDGTLSNYPLLRQEVERLFSSEKICFN